MTIEQKVGQVFIWTYAGTALNPRTLAWLEKYQPGALIVFSRNIQSPMQIAKFNFEMQRQALVKRRVPYFLMIDQEGGTVTRLKTAVPLPSALALGKMEDKKFIQNFGKATAEVLHSLGFNVNLAPVLDITNPDRDSFIGNRAFGEDPDTVAEIVSAYAQGINEGGLIPTAKHFPGHGGVMQDSHQTMPKKLSTYAELADRDLVPFADYAQEDYPRAVMMAHLSLPNIDPTGVPATYSHILIQDYLRAKLEYTGLVITDDLEMSGASIEKDVGERAIKAFLAGNDMLMLAGSPAHQKRAFTAVLDAVRSGRISAGRLKESVSRILNYKNEMKVAAFAFDDKKTREAVVRLETLSREVLKKNFQLALESKNSAEGKETSTLNPGSEVLVLSADKRFFESFRGAYQGPAKFFALTPQTLPRIASELAKPQFEVAIFYATGMQTARWLSRLSPELKSKMIIINANHPGEIEAQPSFLGVYNINSLNPESGASLADRLGSNEPARNPADGRTPATEPSEDK